MFDAVPATSATRVHPALQPVVEFDADLIARLSRNGPRYTSYPTADRFTESFGYRDFLHAVADLRTRGGGKPLSLYLHIPFCDTVCYYCACNKIVTKNREKAATYLAYLKREVEMQGRLFAGMNEVEQLHFGGGTPTYLSDAQMEDLMAHLRRCFRFAPDAAGEYSIEIDPRTVSAERVHGLRRQGFNRISLGVQDFDPDVQRAVNRIQPEAETRAIIAAARDADFRSVSIDLIYGLPKQTPATMRTTLDKVIDAAPDRIAMYHYAHLPHLFKPQRRIDEADMPDSDTKLRMLQLCIERLTAAGYVYIGMDHFARPDDDLAIAQQQGRLHRNFQGYSTHADADLVACGVSAIGAVGATYSQNVKTLDAYYDALDRNELPVARGARLSMDDALRRTIIQKLMCQFELSISAIELAFPIAFHAYFAREMAQLAGLERDGLVELAPDWISVTLKGRLLIRNVCMVFDRYLATRGPATHSRTV
ncbi:MULTISPECIES: oxygen-independent coproporphyrinogen III oxidase [Massilia]|jgi:oxygen-independent coproporphyrinogen-3 oxidase|uniref:Coproporphyrinogen-III oxidase n=2 Tax=Massilia TaxID=149698 RepID=A0A7X3K6J8_9BURK|nr:MULTISPECIES: oxygen-independent coproporphyrinogen III oxidase [Telluria group]KQX98502.1 coproporphyrinogen III oxidase [Massilia sp. Root133]KQZ47187.1 coproporphyrinogen III oxidase [Massilia sp. Root1485]MDN4040820.1 oxygen-independent coproporphyrinogen III oxidase [Massilia sp. YIM B02787]MVW59330.1 oxygen-independent coproporphyrinogen III oxidase [Telluria cellulosilytica]